MLTLDFSGSVLAASASLGALWRDHPCRSGVPQILGDLANPVATAVGPADLVDTVSDRDERRGCASELHLVLLLVESETCSVHY